MGSLRSKAFLLPLALIGLLVISIISMNGYTFIQSHIFALPKSQNRKNIVVRQEQFENLALNDIQVQDLEFTAQMITLSGLYNLSYLVHIDVEGRKSLIRNQLIVLEKLLLICANIKDAKKLSSLIANYIVANSPIGNNFGILDLTNELSIPFDVGVQILPCVRVAPRDFKINLNLAKDETLAGYFDLDVSTASNLRMLISNQKIKNNSALESYLFKIDEKKDFSALLRNIIISYPTDHKALVLYQNFETFAYIDILRDNSDIWNINRSYFLWTPVE